MDMKILVVAGEGDPIVAEYIANRFIMRGAEQVYLATSDPDVSKHELIKDFGIEIVPISLLERADQVPPVDLKVYSYPKNRSVVIEQGGKSVTLKTGEVYGPGIIDGTIYMVATKALYGMPITVNRDKNRYTFSYNLLDGIERTIQNFDKAAEMGKPIFIDDQADFISDEPVAHTINILVNAGIHAGAPLIVKGATRPDEVAPPPTNAEVIGYEPKYPVLTALKFTIGWIILNKLPDVDETVRERFLDLVSTVPDKFQQ